MESGRIDGCGEFKTLIRIVMPLIKPALATVGLLIALAYWNDWYLALLYIKTNKELVPLQTLLMKMQGQTNYMESKYIIENNLLTIDDGTIEKYFIIK